MQGIAMLGAGRAPGRLLVLGAHADDIEIGCGGTILRLCEANPALEVTWVVFCATPQRALEARASAGAFLAGLTRTRVEVFDHRDGYLPYSGGEIKDRFEQLKREFDPELVLTHYREDRHQDHRLVSELSWNTWRNHLILEYEIPKYDGDFGSPNLFSCLPPETLERKIELTLANFSSQAGKHWFSADVLRAVARLRGMECVSPSGLAEGFYSRKAVF